MQQSQGISAAQDPPGRPRCQVPRPEARTSGQDHPKVRNRRHLHHLQNRNLIHSIPHHHISHILNKSLKAGIFGTESDLLGVREVGEVVYGVAVPVGDD